MEESGRLWRALPDRFGWTRPENRGACGAGAYDTEGLCRWKGWRDQKNLGSDEHFLWPLYPHDRWRPWEAGAEDFPQALWSGRHLSRLLQRHVLYRVRGVLYKVAAGWRGQMPGLRQHGAWRKGRGVLLPDEQIRGQTHGLYRVASAFHRTRIQKERDDQQLPEARTAGSVRFKNLVQVGNSRRLWPEACRLRLAGRPDQLHHGHRLWRGRSFFGWI